MGKRALVALFVLAVAFVGGVAPAAAQYAPPSTVPGGGPPEGCPPQDPPRDAPCHPRARGNASKEEVRPGDEVIVSAPAGTFAPNSDVVVTLNRVRRGAPVHTFGTFKSNSNGSFSLEVTIPAGTEPGVYVIQMHGTDDEGDPVTALAPIVVRNANTTAADVRGATFTNSGDSGLPADLAMSPAEEAAAVAAVANGGTLAVTDDGIVATGGSKPKVAAAGLSTTGADLAAPITVGAALVLTGAGLVILRRRQHALVK